MNFEKQLLKRAGKAIHEFKMIREGDRVAVGVSGGKDSLAMVEALRLLRRRSPVRFELLAFTVAQGKFLRPVDSLKGFFEEREIPWTYYHDDASFQLMEEQPDHGCDMCSRYRRRAVYEIASGLEANVVALGHTADDLCESLLRNTLYTGRLGALPAVTYSRSRDFRLIRPLVYVSEEVTAGYCEDKGIGITPCACSFKTGTVRDSMREFLTQVRNSNPHAMENMLAAMGRIDTDRLLDARFLDFEDGDRVHLPPVNDPLPILTEELV